jgi:hypothetical protein
MSHDTGAAGRHWSAAPEMSQEPDSAYYIRLAAKARDLAERATAAGARQLHLEMAADYESRAAQATAP